MAIYESEFKGATIDARLAAVATMQTAISNLETAVAAKYSKPANGIPETDLDASVQAALALARTAVQSLSDYYTKAQVDDITAAIAASVDSTSGVVVTTLPSAGAGTLGKMYYVGPDASGFYDRYVTSYDGSTYSWLALGNTEVDMTQYATVEQLNQLDQETAVSANSPLEVTSTRNMRPVGSQNKIITGNNDYTKIAAVTKGDYLQISFAIASGWILYAFTTEYPAANVAITGYQELNSSATSIKVFAPVTGYIIIASTAVDFTTFSALTDAVSNTIGYNVYKLAQDSIVQEKMSLDVTATRNLRPTSNGVNTGNNGYSYIAVVKEGQSVTVNFNIASNYIYYGFTQTYPKSGVAVSGYGNKNSSYSQLTFIAPFDGFILVDFGVEPSKISIEIPAEKNAIGARVKALESEAARKIDAGDFLGVAAPVNIYYPNDCESGYLDSAGKIAEGNAYHTTPFIRVSFGDIYHISYGLRVAQYDIDKNFISGTFESISDNADATITMVSNAAFFRVTVYENDVFRAMICKGALPESYVPYRVNVPFLSPLSKFEGKKAVLFGDSTTACILERNKANWGIHVTDATGIITENVGIWSARVALSNNTTAVANAFALCSLVDGVVTGDWDAQDIIYETSGYEQHAAQITKLKAIDFSAVDFVVVMIGTNDLASDTPFETQDQPMDKYSVNGALRYFVSQLLGAYPQIKILLMSPIFRFNPSTGDDYTVNGRSIQDFVDDYKGIGEELHLPVLDMLNIGVNKFNCDRYYGANGGDGTHPTDAMREVIGNKVAGALTSLY